MPNNPSTNKPAGSPAIGINTSAIVQKIHSDPMKANQLIKNYRYCLPAYENRVLTYLLTHLEPKSEKNGDIVTNNVVYLDLDEYHAMAGLAPAQGGKDWNIFRKACENLQTRPIDLLDESPDSKYLTRRIMLASSVSTFKDSNKIEVVLTPEARDLFVNVSKMLTQDNQGVKTLGYTRLFVPGIMRMKGAYSGRLYEILKYEGLKKGEKFGVYRVKLDTLRKLMTPKTDNNKDKKVTDLVEGYPNFKDLRTKVLLPSIYEINEYTDIRIDIEDKPVRDASGKIVKHVLNKDKERENLRKIKDGHTITELIFVVEMKSDEEIKALQQVADNDLEAYRAKYDRTITQQEKEALTISLEEKQAILYQSMDRDIVENDDLIVVNNGLEGDDIKKRHNLAKAINRSLGDAFRDEMNQSYGKSEERINRAGLIEESSYKYDDFIDVFIDAIWDDVKALGEESLVLAGVNQLIISLDLTNFIRRAMFEYGTEAFWEQHLNVKFRKMYLRKTLQNLLKDRERVKELLRTSYNDSTEDLIADFVHYVPKFEKNDQTE